MKSTIALSPRARQLRLDWRPYLRYHLARYPVQTRTSDGVWSAFCTDCGEIWIITDWSGVLTLGILPDEYTHWFGREMAQR